MRNPERIPIVLEYIGKIWQRHPDWRLGQLLCNLSHLTGKNVWDMEEDELINAIREHLQSACREKPSS